MTKVLIIDDRVEVAVLLSKLLAMGGYQVIVENRSSKAYETALSFKPDIITLDLMMPDPDGFKLCRILRADPHFAYTSIIIVTALDDNDSRGGAFDAGANDYITKPVHPKELVERIENVLRGKRLGLYDE